MPKTATSILQLVGDTPLLRLNEIPGELASEIWVKLEFLNPSGSVKDRIALRNDAARGVQQTSHSVEKGVRSLVC